MREVPDRFSHLDMTGKGQAAEPLTVSRRSLAACLHTHQAAMLQLLQLVCRHCGLAHSSVDTLPLTHHSLLAKSRFQQNMRLTGMLLTSAALLQRWSCWK